MSWSPTSDLSVLFFNFEHSIQTFLCYLLKLWNFSFWMQSRININDFDYDWEVQMLRYIVWNILITFYNFIRLINCSKSILQLNQKIYKYICDQQTLGIYQNASRWIKNFQNFPFWMKATLFQTRPIYGLAIGLQQRQDINKDNTSFSLSITIWDTSEGYLLQIQWNQRHQKSHKQKRWWAPLNLLNLLTLTIDELKLVSLLMSCHCSALRKMTIWQTEPATDLAIHVSKEYKVERFASLQ